MNKEIRKEMVQIYPKITPLHELVSTLHLMKKKERVDLPDWPRWEKSGSTSAISAQRLAGTYLKASHFLFNQPSWMRSFAKSHRM